MAYVIETGMSPQEFVDVASSRMPLINLIQQEMDAFDKKGWQAIPDMPSEKRLSIDDRYTLRLFRHNIAQPEGFFNSMVLMARRGKDELTSWYESAQHIYRVRPALGQMIRSICDGLLHKAGEKGMSVVPRVQSEMHFRDEYHELAKTAFRNIVLNSIKYGNKGGTTRVWDDDADLFFEDDGPGMSKDLAKKLGHEEGLRERRITGVEGKGLGWSHIGKVARRLGWEWEIVTGIGKGFIVRIRLNESNFVPPDKVITTKMNIFTGDELVSASELIAGASVYIGVSPFEGYRLIMNNEISVSQSPIYLAIGRSRKLLEVL
ncbi:MAG: sensor histidine kinase [candidate division Zixibacteria bacterium]|nr:sensor histidine kinase [candidate division Zixibacteria bacterium]